MENYYQDCSSLPSSNFLNVFKPRNLEKLSDKYGYGQLSIKYFLITTDIIKEAEGDKIINEMISKRRKLLELNGLDLNSCLQFLLDYYTQLMKPQVNLESITYKSRFYKQFSPYRQIHISAFFMKQLGAQ